jgi:hypothetical protein
MDTDELREHLRDMAATRSIDAAVERDTVDSRARRYRRHRRRIASSLAALGVVGLVVVLIIVANNGNRSQSVRVPPAESNVAPPPPAHSVADCVRYWEGYQRTVDPKGDPTELSFFDHGTGGAATLTVEDYCQQVLALEEADPSASDAGFEVSNGRVVRGTPTTSTPGTRDAASQPCVFQRDQSDFYALAQPATITLPDGNDIPILPGNTLTAPQSVTLDGDGSPPGDSGTAASLLWGAATDGGPFAGLESASAGDTVILRQAAPTECVQRWRVTQVVTSQDSLTPNRPVLRLVGFAPTDAGPTTMFYVEAVPE